MQKYSSVLFRTCMRSSAMQVNHFKPMSLYAKNTQNFGVMETVSNMFGSKADITEDIQKDHRALEDYYKQYKAAKTVEDGHKWFNQFLWEICRHSAAEEIIMYNMMEAKDAEGKKLAEKSREDHRELKVMLEDLRKETDEKKFEEKFDAVYKSFQDHVKLEEGEDVPYLKKNVSDEARAAASKAFAMKKNLVPTRPHPGIPDKPTSIELALGMLAMPVDKMRDLFVEFPDKKKL